MIFTRKKTMHLVALATTLTDTSPFSRQEPPDSCLPFIRWWLKYGMTPNQYQTRRLRFMEAFSQQLATCMNQHSHVTREGPPTSLPETFSFYLEGFRFSYHLRCRHYPCREVHNARRSPPDNHTYTVMIEHMETRRTLIRTLDTGAFNKICIVLYLRKLTGSPMTSPVFTGEGRMNLRALPFHRHSLNNIDLSGADLSYSMFSGARLTGVNLENVHMDHACLYNTHFDRCRLSGASLSRTIFRNCDFSGLVFRHNIHSDAARSGESLTDNMPSG